MRRLLWTVPVRAGDKVELAVRPADDPVKERHLHIGLELNLRLALGDTAGRRRRERADLAVPCLRLAHTGIASTELLEAVTVALYSPGNPGPLGVKK